MLINPSRSLLQSVHCQSVYHDLGTNSFPISVLSALLVHRKYLRLNHSNSYCNNEGLPHFKLGDSFKYSYKRTFHSSNSLNVGNRILYTPPKKTKKMRDMTMKEFKMGLVELKAEVRKWRQEVAEKFEADPIMIRPGDTDKVFNFKTKEDLDRWMVTTDKDKNSGNSTAELSLSPLGHGLFSGCLDTTPPADGRISYTGVANITTKPLRKSFKREICYDWSLYTHLVLRVRGDGRKYRLLINTAGAFDITWFDLYVYILYTRGGPYWQTVTIPFSKFIFSAKGRLQDTQIPISLDRVKRFGITAADKINAPFRLEIDYIALHCDPSHTEESAYEMYKLPVYVL